MRSDCLRVLRRRQTCVPDAADAFVHSCSEFTPEGRRETHLDTILLNGNNVAIVRRALFAWRLACERTHPPLPCSLCQAGRGRLTQARDHHKDNDNVYA